MRYKISVATALAVAALSAAPAAAQVQMQPLAFAPAATPLPAALAPDAAANAPTAEARISGRRFLVSVGIGTLAGATAGLLVGAVTTDGCQEDESWCILGWEEEVAIHGVAGAMVGAGIGAVYGLVSGSGRPRTRTDAAPVTVAPSADGGVTVGVSQRH